MRKNRIITPWRETIQGIRKGEKKQNKLMI